MAFNEKVIEITYQTSVICDKCEKETVLWIGGRLSWDNNMNGALEKGYTFTEKGNGFETICPKCQKEGDGVKKWVAKEGSYTYTIEESGHRHFDLTIDHLGDKMYLWFPSYQSARDYLRREEDFIGRMKQVKEGAE
ncbi:hypothetical protein [Bacillus inaquosorum]|uniref:hypothetical protein n=1 Tax=Bacillus inaquosorum TaxID=483913 RepID=UPI002282398D|nr:hypothetical protein [Bacillus inaquosorum]MCY7943901.1 hypothetical protein [Bacillus inaquosorum]MCY8798204.1 hypothetical protein [Bacillus inaquosorum]MCY9014308.1 hypothetical protein [Bacillus inaquosorum]MEC0772956.1 hypothetical protein [Bacillus inaquosorum]MEC0796995.1 hypothetical protein [Bacillus inaquosorum]